MWNQVFGVLSLDSSFNQTLVHTLPKISREKAMTVCSYDY